MFTIQFNMLSLAEKAFYYFTDNKYHDFIICREQSSITISNQQTDVQSPDLFKKRVQQMLHAYIIDCYEKTWCIQRLISRYFYEDDHEQELILNILDAVFLGEMACLPKVSSLPNRQDVLTSCLDGVFDSTYHLSFHSITRFRLDAYHKLLQLYLEIAIDEYKLQEEYQAFTEKLTMMIRAFRPLYHTVYVSDGDQSLQLFTDQLEKLDMNQTLRSFYPLLKQWGIEAEPSPLLALIALAPEKVVVYSKRPAQPLLMTLSRVFGDRLSYKPPSEFQLLSNK